MPEQFILDLPQQQILVNRHEIASNIQLENIRVSGVVSGTGADEIVYPPDSIMSSLAFPAAVAVMDECPLKYRRYMIVDEMMHNSIPEIGGKDFSLYRFVHDETYAWFRFVSQGKNLFGEFKQIGLEVHFEAQCIDGAPLVSTCVKVGLKEIQRELPALTRFE